MSTLDLYRSKRDFTRTREPKGGDKRRDKDAKGGAFVVQKHAARRLHYDFRLEHGGVLWSWAVTRGPSLDPAEKRLAVHVEDHPLEYGGFEGTIPAGQYGGGSVIVWDEGRWIPEGDPAAGMKKGHLVFVLEGHKLQGRWHLVRLKPRRGEKRDNWLLIKSEDEFVRTDEDILETQPDSVKSGLSVEAIGQDESKGGVWDTTKPAGEAAAAVRPLRKAPARKTRKSDASALPDFIEPCLATLQEKPPTGENWLHEVKFDGYRLQGRIDHGQVRLLTRSGLDWTARFGKGLAAALTGLPCETALIDGELVALAENGISSFSALQDALSAGRAAGLVYFAFDLLHLDDEDLRGEPLLARKERLKHLLEGIPAEGPLRFSEHFIEPGGVMLDHACRMGLEGVVSKRADAPYRSGRGRDWIKSKCTQRQEFVIAGYVPSKASPRKLGSIVAGYYENGELKPAGRVGTGFTATSAAALKAKLDKLATDASPFKGAAGRERGVVWVKPERVAEVEFRAWTASKTLRHAAFIGLREDKPAGEIVAEMPVGPVPQKPKARKTRAAAGRVAPARTSVKLSSPDKPLWPESGFTKQDLLAYYAKIWPLMQRFVVGRPLSLVRAPNGIEGHRFFQKHAGPGMHDAVRRRKDADGEELIYIEDFDGLAALVQLGTVEIHVWGATIDAVETPDQIIFDLDPDTGVPVERVREAALTVRRHLDDLGFANFLKVSGGKGFHVVLPLKPKADWERVKTFARDFARAMEQAEPKLYTATLSKKARRGRIFIDYLRNGRGATAIAPYSTRARTGVPLAMPVEWQDIDSLQPDAFKARAILDGDLPPDLWSGFFAAGKPLTGG
ncbi:DNA ligase D [Bosea beijingensis]|uniref:DNA ligase D n=1 Tax=Bosea beijingensis TaxID=3068632 RepID=UPI0027409DB1|nr:DNA ligase D [Bosea sp. REN20]